MNHSIHVSLPAILSGIDWPQLVLGVIGAGAATWFGAWAAFKHERRDRLETEHKHQGEALKRALFILLSQRTVLVNIRDQHLAGFEKNPLRHILVKPFYVASDELSLDLDPLLFVLNTSDADLLNRLQVCNRRCRSILATIELRNNVQVQGQNLLAERLKTESTWPEEIKGIIGPQRWAQLRDFTDFLYESLPRALAEIDVNYAAVEAVARSEFPNVKLFAVEKLSP